jgi:hypothetical protein
LAESQETSDYPGALDNWVTLTDKEDLAEQSDINKMKAAIEAVQTELGVDVAGSKTNLDARLDQCIAENGAMRSGTSMPVSPTPQDGDFFYRTDQNVMYIYNGSTWDAQGQSLSNVIFSFGWGRSDQSENSYGFNSDRVESTSQNLSAGDADFTADAYLNNDTTYRVAYRTKFKKLPGQTSVVCYAHMNRITNNAGTYYVQFSIGGQTAEDSDTNVSATWLDGVVDVSGLTDGTVYDITVSTKMGGASCGCALYGGIGIAY